MMDKTTFVRFAGRGNLAVFLLCSGAYLSVGVPAYAGIAISSEATQNVDCSGGICVPTAKKAVLNVNDVESLLASGDVEVTTTGSGVEADNIRIDAALGWSGANTLALEAHDSIAVSAPVSVTGLGGLTLSTSTLSFGAKANVSFANLSSSLIINGTPYTLENSVKTLARAIKASPGGAYALAGDYDAAQDGIYPDCPITTELDGTLQGLGNTISNLSIFVPNGHRQRLFAALIWEVGTTGSVANLRLTGLHYKAGRTSYADGLAVYNEGYLFGDEVSGLISAPGAGGLVSANLGTIVSSSANIHMKHTMGLAGGLAGYNEGTISLSSARGTIAYGVIAGGLVSYNSGTIDQSYSTVKVQGGTAGGIAVYTTGDGTISNSYTEGSVNVNSDSGGAGLVVDGGGIESSYAAAAVNSVDGLGFACQGGPFTSDYWDITASGTDNGTCDGDPGVTGLTTQQLQSGLPEGFDPKIWAENPKINHGLPYLIANPPKKD